MPFNNSAPKQTTPWKENAKLPPVPFSKAGCRFARQTIQWRARLMESYAKVGILTLTAVIIRGLHICSMPKGLPHVSRPAHMSKADVEAISAHTQNGNMSCAIHHALVRVVTKTKSSPAPSIYEETHASLHSNQFPAAQKSTIDLHNFGKWTSKVTSWQL